MGSRAVTWLLAGVLMIGDAGCTQRSQHAATRETDQALILAAHEGDLERVQSLLHDGANPNARMKVGSKIFGFDLLVASSFSPMVALACRQSTTHDVAIALLLHRHGAEIDINDGKGGSPLIWAVFSGNEPLAMWLIEQGADVHRSGGPYHHGMMSPLATACELQPELAIAMIDRGADPNRRLQGTPPLSRAAFAGHIEVVRRLLHAGADPNAHDVRFTAAHGEGRWIPEDDATPLAYAARGFAQEVRYSTAQLEDQTHDPYERHFQVLELLLAAGADKGADEALWRLAVEIPFVDPLSDSVDLPALTAGQTEQLVALARNLIEVGADVSGRYSRTPKPLFGDDQRFILLLALLDEPPREVFAEPSRMEQWRQLTFRLAQLLVEAGADVNVADEEGHTPLHHAVYIGEPQIIELLLRHGAIVDARDSSDATPLMMLMSVLDYYRNAGEHYEAARLLVDAGARLTPQEVQPYKAWIDQADEFGGEVEGVMTYDPRLAALLKSASR